MTVDPAAIQPTPAEVASHIHTRTRDEVGREHGTFDAETRPTETELTPLIARASRYVSREIGDRFTAWTDELAEAAKDTVAAFAALYVEQSFYDDEGTDGNTAADRLGRIAREQLAALLHEGGRGRLLGSVQMAAPTDPVGPSGSGGYVERVLGD